jgi:hypothetical protein
MSAPTTHPGQVVIITGAVPTDSALADSAAGPVAIPEPPVRPDRKAQWDEVHGCWIRWDDDVGEWLPESQPLVVDLRDEPTEPPPPSLLPDPATARGRTPFTDQGAPHG